jgi:hypothetical protein
MAVLMRLANGQGACDKRCYDADHERCTCKVCGGLLHGIGKDRALVYREQIIHLLDQTEAIGEAVPHRVDDTKRRQPESVIVLERRIEKKMVRRLRAPSRLQAEVAAGQLTLWQGAERPTPLLPPTPLARPRKLRLVRA